MAASGDDVHHAVGRVTKRSFERRFVAESFPCRRPKGTHATLRAQVFVWRYPLKRHALTLG